MLPELMVLSLVAGLLALQRPATAPAPTRVVRFTPPAELPARSSSGECQAGSVAAGYRADAYRCTAGASTYDPCFSTTRAAHVLCDVDPRDPARALVVTFSNTPVPAHEAAPFGSRAWFIELTDGSTCTPIAGTRREIGGLIEVFGCRFAQPADADGTLGDLDASRDVWTLQKVLLNKKVEPQTIKSVMMTPIATAWQ